MPEKTNFLETVKDAAPYALAVSPRRDVHEQASTRLSACSAVANLISHLGVSAALWTLCYARGLTTMTELSLVFALSQIRGFKVHIIIYNKLRE